MVAEVWVCTSYGKSDDRACGKEGGALSEFQGSACGRALAGSGTAGMAEFG